MNKMITILFFTGTGGVKKIAYEFEQQLNNKLFTVSNYELDFSNKELNFVKIDNDILKSQYFFILFPIHAFDAPDIIYSWIKETKANNKNTIVISVSGGGEVWPNIGTRVNCIKSLEKKNFKVIYEKMMVMSSNFMFETNDHLSMWLIKAIPDKVNKIIDAILSGKQKRINIKKKPLFQSWITKLEKRNAYKFGKTLKINDKCICCKECVDHCPNNNIEMIDNKPIFLDKCIMCFRCIYSCPTKAIKSNNFMVLKNGFNLNKLENKMKNINLEPIDKCCKGLLWIGVKNYLIDKDGF